MNSSATSISPETTARPRRESWRAWLFRHRYVVILLSLLMLSFAAFLYFQTTYVSGVELNTANFQMRSFSFRRDPLTNGQLTGVQHEKAPWRYRLWTAVSTFSTIDPAIQPHLNSTNAQSRWDLVRYDQELGSGNRGDALILADLLSLTNAQGKLYWPEWTGNHPKQAAVFWPAVQDLAGLQLYARLPDVFELALLGLEEKEFASALNDQLQSILLSEAKREQKAGNHSAAAKIAEVGLTYGQNEELSTLTDSVQAEIESFE